MAMVNTVIESDKRRARHCRALRDAPLVFAYAAALPTSVSFGR